MNREMLDDVISTLQKRAVVVGGTKKGTTIYRISSQREFRGCVDCGSTGELYMVHDAIWTEAFFEKNELACIGCLEKRLKRPLKISDFTTCLANINLFHAYRMGLDAAEAQHAVDRNREQESSRAHISHDAAVCGIKTQCLPNGRRPRV